jgi:hypothetical protein
LGIVDLAINLNPSDDEEKNALIHENATLKAQIDRIAIKQKQEKEQNRQEDKENKIKINLKEQEKEIRGQI